MGISAALGPHLRGLGQHSSDIKCTGQAICPATQSLSPGSAGQGEGGQEEPDDGDRQAEKAGGRLLRTWLPANPGSRVTAGVSGARSSKLPLPARASVVRSEASIISRPRTPKPRAWSAAGASQMWGMWGAALRSACQAPDSPGAWTQVFVI